MSIFTESTFNNIANVRRPRTKYPQRHTLKTTFNEGKLVPIYCKEVLPGETDSMNMCTFMRSMTPITSVMDDSDLDITFFFVPNRLLWTHFEEFMGENKTGHWIPQVEYTMPRITLDYGDTGEVSVGSLYDYMGLGSFVPDRIINALPFRAYYLIYNEWWRDQNLIDPLLIHTNLDNENFKYSMGNGVYFGELVNVSKHHDYFTSCLPGPQKGPDVLIPMSAFAPLDSAESLTEFKSLHEMQFGSYNDALETLSPVTGTLTARGASGSVGVETSVGNHDSVVSASNLGINLENYAGSINDLRMAFQLQKYYELLARGGSRYIETLNTLFGVQAGDSRLQRPELLAAKRISITMNQVVQSAPITTDGTDETTPLGTIGGYSLTRDRGSLFTKSFVEHGWLIGLACVRVHHSYSQGIRKQFFRKNFEDYYNPLFNNIGMQPVYKTEIYAGTYANPVYPDKDNIFGYQDAWQDYRQTFNYLTGYMRPDVTNSIGAYWTYADNYSAAPTLSKAWIEEGKENIDQTLAVPSGSTAHQFLADFYFDNSCVLPMGADSTPGFADHF